MNEFSTPLPLVPDFILACPLAIDETQVFDKHSVSVASDDLKACGTVFTVQAMEMMVNHTESVHLSRTQIVYIGER